MDWLGSKADDSLLVVEPRPLDKAAALVLETEDKLRGLWSPGPDTGSTSLPRHSSGKANPKADTTICRREEFGGKNRSHFSMEGASKYFGQFFKPK